MIEDGATENEVQAFVDMRAAKRKATADYKAKLEDIAEYFRQQYKVEEERKKDIEGEQMKREAEEKEDEAKNIAFILKSNEELKRERFDKRYLFKQITNIYLHFHLMCCQILCSTNYACDASKM